MSKKVNFQNVTESGHTFGQNISSTDIMNSQDFAHSHAETITKDFCTNLYETDIAGFNPSPVGLTVNISDGRIYQNGIQFDATAVQLTHDAAHATYPRIDLIVATVAQNAGEDLTFTLFQRIRTPEEIGDGVSPYQPVQFEIPRTKHNKVTLSIKKGVAGASPTAPALADGEIALWAVAIAANTTSLLGGNFSDRRRLAANLRNLQAVVDGLMEQLEDIGADIATLQAYRYDLVNVNWESSFGGVRPIHSVFEEIGLKILTLKWRYPSVLTGDGRVQAVGNMDGSTPVIDIPIGTLVQFGDKFVTIQPDAFTDEALAARHVTSGIDNTNTLFDGMTDEFGLDGAQNTVRVNAPTGTKWLYLGYDGSLYFKSEATGSNSNECMLLRSTFNVGASPTLLTYITLRNAVITKTGVATASTSSRQFVNNIALPPGVGSIKAYAIKDGDKALYSVDLSAITAYDQTVTITGVTEDDTWVVEIHLYSVY